MKSNLFLKLIRVILLLLFYSNGFGQNQTLERLNADKINYAILFRLEKINGIDQLTYEIDPRDAALNDLNTARSKPIESNQKPLHLASTSSAFNIMFSFYNPLKYRYKVDLSESIDPSSLAFEKFYSSVLDITKKLSPEGIGGGHTASISETITRSYETFNYRDYPVTNIELATPIKIIRVKSDELIDWVLWYLQNRSGRLPIITGENGKILEKLVESYIKTEQYMYDKLDEETTEALTGNKSVTLYYESYIAELLEKLRGAENRSEFELQLNKINASLTQLKGYNDRTLKLCEEIEKLELKEGKIEAEKYFVDYTKNKRTIYIDKVKSIIKSRVGIIESFNSLIKDINANFLPTIAANNATKQYALNTKIGAIYQCKIQIIKSNYLVENGAVKRKEDKAYEFEMIISEYTSLVAEFGLGTIFFPTVNADIFSSSNNIVTKTTSKLFFSPMASLNLIPNISKGQAFWMLQLGVGSNIDKPTVALGTGIRIYNVRESTFRNFSVTVGVVSCFVRRLNTLREGDTADQLQLDRDLYYSPEFRPYIGIQVNF